jgi:hypothetical protein
MSKEREVLKLARDVLLPYKSTGLRWYTDVDEALDAIEEVLAQPEEQRSCDKQEPVGVVALDTSRPFVGGSYNGQVMPWSQAPAVKTVVMFKDLPLNTPLYIDPPQRPWVGLDFETIEECFPEGPSVFEDAYGDNHTSPRWLHAFARAIEAKLKEKNT